MASIYDAALANNLERVQELVIGHGISVHQQDDRGTTPLHHAVAGGSLEVIQWLFDQGADLNARSTSHHVTSLHVAITNGTAQVAELLLRLGAEVEAYFDNEQRTPLHLACLVGAMEIAEVLVRRNANPFAIDQNGFTPLHCACHRGDLPLVEFLLQIDGSDINVPTNKGITPLHLAVNRSHLHIIRYLLEQGADVERTGAEEAKTPLHVASGEAANLEAVQLLLEFGADPMARDTNEMTPIFRACKANRVDIVEAFLDGPRGADLLASTIRQQWTCLHVTCSAGNLIVARLLLQRGANLEAKSEEDQRPLHLACFEGHLDLIPLLLEEGAELEPMDLLFSLTPLGMAAFNYHTEAVRILLDQGANLEVNRNEHWSVLDVACRVGGLDVAELVLDRVGIVESLDTNGPLGPLYEAARHNHSEIVWILVKRYPWLLAGTPDD